MGGKSMDESAASKAAHQPPLSSSPLSTILPSRMEVEDTGFSLGTSKPITPTKSGGGGMGKAGTRHHHHQHHRSVSSPSTGASAAAAGAGRSPATPLFGGLSSTSTNRIATALRDGGMPSAFQGFIPPSTSFSTLPPAADQQRELQQAAQTFREKASSLYLGKNYEKSLHEFTNALLLAPDGWPEKPKLYCNRAAALIMLHRYEDAVKDCEKAIQGDPHLLKAYTRCGRAYLHMGVLDRAYVCFDEVRSRAEQRLVAKFGPDAPPIPPVVMTTPGGSSSSSSRREGAYQQRAEAYEKKGLDEAIQEAKEGRAEVSMVEQALQAAELHSKKVEWGEALERVDAALRFAHRAKNAMRLKLLALCKLKRWEGGVRFCEKYYAPSKAELFPTSPSTTSSTGISSSSPSPFLHPNPHAPIHVIVRMGSLEQRSYIRCLRYTDREDDAVAALKTLLARHGHVMWVEKEIVRIKSIRNAKEAGDAAFRKQNFDLALGHYAEALKLDPEWDMMNAVLHCNRGAAHMALRLFEQAKDDCTHALRRKPDYWKAFLRRARAWREMKRWEESVADYTTYLKHALPKGTAGEGEEGKEGGGAGGPTGATGSAADVRSEMEGVQREMKLEKLEKERREFAKKRQQQQRQRQQSSFGWRGGRGGGGPYRGWGRGRGSIFGEGESDKEDEDDDDDDDDEEEDGAGIFQDFFEFYRKHNNRESERGARGGASFASNSDRRTPGAAPPGAGRSSSSSSSRSGFEGSYRRGFNFSGAGPGSSSGNSSGPGARSSKSSTSGWSRSRSSSSVPPSGSSSSSSSAVVTHYSVLGIARASSSGEVKKAFHRLALKFHPDKNKEAGAEEMFKKVSEAYNVLSDHSARRLYDAELRVGGGGF